MLAAPSVADPYLACAWRALAYGCVLTPPTVERVDGYICLCSAAFTSFFDGQVSRAFAPCGAPSWQPSSELEMGGCGREISPQSTARLSESAAAPAPAEADPDPSSLGLVAEISELLRLPPLPPRATLERVKALLTAARAVAAVDSLDQGALYDAGTDTLVPRGAAGTRPLSHEQSAAALGVVRGPIGAVRDIRADKIRAAQLARERHPSSIGSRLAEGQPPPTNDLSVKVLNEKRSGMV